MTELIIQNDSLLSDLIRDVIAGQYNHTQAGRLLYAFYSSGVDSLLSPQNSKRSLKRHLNLIRQVRTKSDLQHYLANQLEMPSNRLMGLYAVDDVDTTRIVQAVLGQAGLNRPLKYYQLNLLGQPAVQQAYLHFLASIWTYLGYSMTTAHQNAGRVLAVEKQLAAYCDSTKSTHRLRYAQLVDLFPNLPWRQIFNRFAIPHELLISVEHPRYYAGLNKLLVSIPLADWKLKLAADFVLYNMAYLGPQMARTHYNYVQRTLWRSQTPYSPKRQVMDLMTDYYDAYSLADLLGDLYARNSLGQSDKAKIYRIANGIKAVFTARLKAIDWLAPQTKQLAIKKIQTLIVKIGYPDTLASMRLKFTKDNYLANYHQLFRLKRGQYLQAIGKAKDRTAWRRPPWSIASSYEPDYNGFIIAAGSLKPPFYFSGGEDALNYGAIGTLIGHELSHALDNLGKNYDVYGTKREWWTGDDSIRFSQKISPLIKQYNGYRVLANIPIDGTNTVGETMADLTGLLASYEAFQQTDQYRAGKPLEGLTPTQRFIVAFAQQWRASYTDKALKETVQTDVHPPESIRVNGSLSNFPPFYESFPVRSGDQLYRSESVRIKVW
ncbi:M13 family metallopeptidase [Spirosoma horti]